MPRIRLINIFNISAKIEEIMLFLNEALEDPEIVGIDEKTEMMLGRLIESLNDSEIPIEHYAELSRLYESSATSPRQIYEELIRFHTYITDDLKRAPPVRVGEEGMMRDVTLLESREGLEDTFDDAAYRDFESGIYCLVHGYHTAAGFMFFRSLERMAIDLYEIETGDEVDNYTFGQMVSNLREHYEDLDDRELMEFRRDLHFLKEIRNKVAHPQLTLEREDAERIYDRVIQAVETINERIAELES